MRIVDISVVIPFYNEGVNLIELRKELLAVLGKLKVFGEIIYVNDGSTDGSAKSLEDNIKEAPNAEAIEKIINFRRNFGQTAATSAGIDEASGKLVAFMDADLQNDPNDLIKFMEKINEGYDAVFGWRKNREDDFARSFSSRIANFVIQKLFKIPLHDVGCSLRVVKKEVISNIHLYGESHRIMPVLIYWKGINVCELVVNHRRRIYGKSKYGYARVLKLIIDLITLKFLNSYGTKPAYVFGTFGILSIFIGFIAMLVVLYQKLILDVFVHRNPVFLIAIVLILIGVQLILMGLLAELLVRIYFESQKKTTYEIKDIKSF